MLREILFAIMLCLAVIGAVAVFYLVFLRILRPRNEMYAVICFLYGGRLDPSCRVSFIRERLRLFGESKRCKIIVVLCEFESDEEIALRAAFSDSTDIIFTHEAGLPQILCEFKQEAVKIT